MSGDRIQKVLADAGVASRRAVEAMVAEGRIKVNGEAATAGQKIVAGDRVTVDGRTVLLVDEVGLLGTERMVQLLRLVKARGAKLVMIGDPQQLRPTHLRGEDAVRRRRIEDGLLGCPAFATSLAKVDIPRHHFV